MRKIFRYFEPAWQGTDGKVSVRAILAIAFSVDFIRNLSHAVYKWEAGRSLDSLGMLLTIEAGLIVALLGLTTLQNTQAFAVTTKTEAQITQNQQVIDSQKTITTDNGN